ncbi:pyridoxamine 5'-phosphate oxidase-related [Desulfocucumis palustris]|uniref:Pyridoxamine 5'-phosphate oxidase-related n=1 Tax=Desulfocucumis palustris TaxID=1898651 RepID=A0A2L2XL23_9FIRM|nr:pyridoxamine 5'-phosphate oxidase family protein [Desulfocucumis palustris]GBF34996.1 pyridoxamine 5'-phosphate oxidase-related [Desulfocucumis palustris]
MPHKELPPGEIHKMLTEEKVGRLATLGGDGPYIIPMCFVWDNNVLYLHSRPKGTKIDNIISNPSICFEISRVDKWLPREKPCAYSINYRSVQVFGKARILPQGEEKVRALNLLSEKYLGGAPFEAVSPKAAAAAAVIKIPAEHVSGRQNNG